MPSKRTAARVFIVRTDASKPTSPRTKRSCRYANVVTCPGTTSWLTSCWNSGTEIWSDAFSSYVASYSGEPFAVRACPR